MYSYSPNENSYDSYVLPENGDELDAAVVSAAFEDIADYLLYNNNRTSELKSTMEKEHWTDVEDPDNGHHKSVTIRDPGYGGTKLKIEVEAEDIPSGTIVSVGPRDNEDLFSIDAAGKVKSSSITANGSVSCSFVQIAPEFMQQRSIIIPAASFTSPYAELEDLVFSQTHGTVAVAASLTVPETYKGLRLRAGVNGLKTSDVITGVEVSYSVGADSSPNTSTSVYFKKINSSNIPDNTIASYSQTGFSVNTNGVLIIPLTSGDYVVQEDDGFFVIVNIGGTYFGTDFYLRWVKVLFNRSVL
jgi:hypothetical protein